AFVSELAQALGMVGRARQAALVLETFVPLEEKDYADAAVLRRCLERFASEGELTGSNAASYVYRLADALYFADRPRQAALVLEAFVPLEEKDYADAETLNLRLQHFASERDLEGNNTAIYVQAIAKALGSAGRARQAALVLEAFV